MKLSVAPLLKQPVGSRIDYRVEEGPPIDPRGDNAELLDAGVTSIDADIEATHTDSGAYLEGDARATVSQECARCLRPIQSPVETHFAEQYYATQSVDTGEALAPAPLDAKMIGSDFTIDLTPLLREEVIFATPQAPLCRPDCKGLCPTCGIDLNERPHEHDEVVDDRWAKLGALAELRVDKEREDREDREDR